MDNANKTPVVEKEDEIILADGDFFDDLKAREKKWLEELGVKPEDIDK